MDELGEQLAGTMSSTMAGPCGRLASQSRCSVVSASAVQAADWSAAGLNDSGISRPAITLSWLPRIIAAGARARTRSMTSLGPAP